MILSRNKLFFYGLAVIFMFYLLNRVNFINKSAFTFGKVKPDKEMELSFTQQNDISNEKVIEFAVDTNFYCFFSNDFVKLKDNHTVRVIYNKKNPFNAYVFNFTGFWLYGLLFCIFPIMVWGAFVYSYVTYREKVEINIFKLRFKKHKNTHSDIISNFRKLN